MRSPSWSFLFLGLTSSFIFQKMLMKNCVLLVYQRERSAYNTNEPRTNVTPTTVCGYRTAHGTASCLPKSQCGWKRSPARTAMSLRLCGRTNSYFPLAVVLLRNPAWKHSWLKMNLRSMAAQKLAFKPVWLLCKGRVGVCCGTGREESEEDMLWEWCYTPFFSCGWRFESLLSWEFFFFSFFYKVTAIELVMALMDGK